MNRLAKFIFTLWLISMSEAFSYAQLHDRRDETPQYCSMPADLGDRLSLWGLQEEANGVATRETDECLTDVFSMSGIRLDGAAAANHAIRIERKGGKARIVIRN